MRDSTSISCRVLTPQRMSKSPVHLDMEAQQLFGDEGNVQSVPAQITDSNA